MFGCQRVVGSFLGVEWVRRDQKCVENESGESDYAAQFWDADYGCRGYVASFFFFPFLYYHLAWSFKIDCGFTFSLSFLSQESLESCNQGAK